jgi:hypothetical protein
MAIRDDRQSVMDEESSSLPWGNTLKHAPVVLTLSALVIYGYLSICYDGFYRALGVDPGDVSLSYAAILARSEVVPLAVELRRRSMGDQAASSLAGVTAAVVWSSATRRAGR